MRSELCLAKPVTMPHDREKISRKFLFAPQSAGQSPRSRNCHIPILASNAISIRNLGDIPMIRSILSTADAAWLTAATAGVAMADETPLDSHQVKHVLLISVD